MKTIIPLPQISIEVYEWTLLHLAHCGRIHAERVSKTLPVTAGCLKTSGRASAKSRQQVLCHKMYRVLFPFADMVLAWGCNGKQALQCRAN